jgi:hypothetical protein
VGDLDARDDGDEQHGQPGLRQQLCEAEPQAGGVDGGEQARAQERDEDAGLDGQRAGPEADILDAG